MVNTPIAFISHPECLLHDMGESHPEQPARLQVIENELIELGYFNTILKRYVAPLATPEQLLKVHDEGYLNYIFKCSPKNGLITLDPDTKMNPYSLTAALRAAGAAVLGVDLVMAKQVGAAYCNIRPPGHHAERNRAMGFCFFNNIAVGAMYAIERYQLKRIAIIDFDVHHGNGTEDIFQYDERILYCSSFQHPFYPFCGADTKNDHIINVPLPAGASGKIFREQSEKAWFKKIEKFQPEMIFISAGFDAYFQDPMANLNLKEEDYFWITQEIKKIANNTCKGRLVSVLEGGYDLDGLGRCAGAHIRGLLE